ncbi:D-2-hydroxyacid dehydrogenase [Fulvivirgaceae bacterium BMA10]|uniref:D-2-hydroxyacid dehydrogenase n=2 Tax=Splendidivirga corallicola TaxID=3051826 RepID=A0ABT8KVJ9_9BACT|nr:D-2-hydroxyacid dehydrogenase [Fulvivirgaceae bacterium BMA10]
MKIVILDGYTLNPGDLNWEPITSLGETEIYDRTPQELILDRVRDADVILTNKTVLNKETIDVLPHLKFIAVTATGFNNIDTVAARERGIAVSNARDYSTHSVAQHTIALMLELIQRSTDHNASVMNGDWGNQEDFCYRLSPSIELADKNMGIIGFGKIGQRVAGIAQAFGMNILVHRQNTSHPEPPGVRYVSLDTLFKESDVISLHLPLTKDNQGFVDKTYLSLMKPGSYLINTSRGPLINESDLFTALKNEQIAGAGLDVLTIEPPKEGNPLIGMKNCLITPHQAWATRESRNRLMHIVADNIKAFAAGKPINVVN